MVKKQCAQNKQVTTKPRLKPLSCSIANALMPCLVALALIAPPTMAATFTVNSTADPGDGTCDASCTLRDAIIAANGAAGADIIDATGINGTINLTSSLDTLIQSTTINGPGAANLAIDGGDSFRIFRIEPSGAAPVTISTTISGLTLQNGLADTGPAPNFYYCGGAIKNYGEDLTVNDSVITSNAGDFGAGICSRSYYSVAAIGGSLTISNTTISLNTAATFAGGGVYASHISGSVDVVGSTIEQNTSGYFGGGLAIHGQNIDVTISNTTIQNNTATGSGGGMDVVGSNSNLIIDNNSVVSGNQALGAANVFGVNYCANGVGGGVLVYQLDPGDVTISGNTQITGNSAITGTAPGGSCPDGLGNGGGVLVFQNNASGSFTLSSSDVSNNNADGSGAGLFIRQLGASTMVEQSSLSGNISINGGGGMYLIQSGGEVTINQSHITGNTAVLGGGGVLLVQRGSESATINQSTFNGNSASLYGGGLFGVHGNGTASISQSTFSGNTAGFGGGIMSRLLSTSDHRITNCTISGNTALAGSAVFNNITGTSMATIEHSTIFQNTTRVAGSSPVGATPWLENLDGHDFSSSSISVIVDVPRVATLLDHTIVAGGGGPELAGSFDINFSLVENSTGAVFPNGTATLMTADPMLNPLANNSGLTLTHTPLLNGPTVDAGDPAFTAPPSVDQTGAARVRGLGIDIGAFEIQGGGPVAAAISVPTLSQWGLILMGMLLPLTAAAFTQRKRK